MKGYKNLFAVGAVMIFVIPQVAFAAWWNPLSWYIFSPFTNRVSTFFTPNNTPNNVSPLATSTTGNVKISPQTVPTNKGQSVSTKTEAAVPKNSTLCNGTYYSSCPSGSDFVCPGDGGKAYCQSKTQQAQNQNLPVQNQTQTQTQDLSAAVLVKNDAIGTLNKIISSYTYLYNLQTSDIDSMNGVLNALANNNSQVAVALRNLTNLRITRIMNQQAPTKSIIEKAQSDLANLQSQPLSYFLNYQTPTDTYTVLNAFQGFAASFVSDYNMYSSTLTQSTAPVAVPRSTSCTVQSAGGGVATINCF